MSVEQCVTLSVVQVGFFFVSVFLQKDLYALDSATADSEGTSLVYPVQGPSHVTSQIVSHTLRQESKHVWHDSVCVCV